MRRTVQALSVPDNARHQREERAARGMATACGVGHRACGRGGPLFSRPRPPVLPPRRLFFTSSSSPVRMASSTTSQVADSCRRPVRGREAGAREPSSPQDDFVVVSFYKFVLIADPVAEVARHLAFLQGRDINGRIYLNEHGINAQYSGPNADVLAYADWVKEDERFSDILVQVSPACDGHAFPRLKLRYKPSLVQLEGGVSHLPLVDPAMRAHPLTPTEWREKLQAMNNISTPTGKADSRGSHRKSLLLDVRNGYEWDIGHFQGAQRPNVDCFRSTSFGFSEPEVTPSDPLAGIDKENTDILMYCTGGIRCDVYSTILRQQGFQNLYTLSGGISNYLKNEGSAGWVGNLFVFDARLSIPPSTYKPRANTNTYATPKVVDENSTFAKCYVCGSQIPEFRHRNCANLDCNWLFLSCSSCVTRLRGCCCLECTCAPRLRPVLLPGQQRYQKWHIYRDGK